MLAEPASPLPLYSTYMIRVLVALMATSARSIRQRTPDQPAPELLEVDDHANRRGRAGIDLHQVEPRVGGAAQGGRGRHHAEPGAVLGDHSNSDRANLRPDRISVAARHLVHPAPP